ncbi:hypothetical protein CVV67_08665 [Arthrobacter stackebrandtii]|nr:hypothetical protein CVV67_08665 [Arthrobacter stackebrandtii]
MRNKYERLLRWYPKAWREEHGRFMLDTLEEHAGDRGIARPGVAEAWSIRAHGLGERATSRWAVVAAVVSLAAYVVATGILLTDVLQQPGAGAARIVLAIFAGPLALSFAVLILLRRRGQLSAPSALWLAAGAVPSWAVAALAAASWSVGFEEADAGTGQTWFGSSTLLFMLAAWVFGTASLLAPVASLAERKLPAPMRWLLSLPVAAVLSMVLGVAAAMGQMMGAVVAATALVLAVAASRPEQPKVAVAEARRTGPPRSVPRAAAARRSCATAGAMALVSLVAGLACAAFALTGSTWGPGASDSTHAMNLGLAAGALAAMPLVVSAALMLAPRFGKVMWISAALLGAGLVVASASQLSGAGSSLQWPLILLAAVLGSLAFALPVSGLLSIRPAVRLAIGIALGLAGFVPGIMVVSAAGFIAPVVAGVVVVMSARTLSRDRRWAHFQAVSPG